MPNVVTWPTIDRAPVQFEHDKPIGLPIAASMLFGMQVAYRLGFRTVGLIGCDFIGTINSFDARVEAIEGDSMKVAIAALGQSISVPIKTDVAAGDGICLAIRPEKIWISRETPDAGGKTILRGTVSDQGYFGNLSLYRVQLASGTVIQVSSQNRVRSAGRSIDWDDQVHIHWDNESMIVLSE